MAVQERTFLRRLLGGNLLLLLLPLLLLLLLLLSNIISLEQLPEERAVDWLMLVPLPAPRVTLPLLRITRKQTETNRSPFLQPILPPFLYRQCDILQMISRKFHLTACHTTGANSLRMVLIFCYVILCIYANVF